MTQREYQDYPPPTDKEINCLLGDPNVDQRAGIVTLLHYAATRYADAMRRDLDPQFVEETWGSTTRMILKAVKDEFDKIAYDIPSCKRLMAVMAQVIGVGAEVRSRAERKLGQMIVEMDTQDKKRKKEN
jgi:hypothetical protein